MSTVTLATLRSRVRERADLVGSSFVTDLPASLDAFINTSLDELYDVIVQRFSNPYFVSSSTLTTVAGTSSYALPTDFYKLLGVELPLNGRMVDLDEYQFKDRNLYRNASYTSLPVYRLEGSNLRLYPAPSGVLVGAIQYVPTRTQLVNASDSCSFPQGWEEYAVIDAGIKCLNKEESDPSALMAEKAAMLERITLAAENRNPGQPEQAIDVESDGGSLWPDRWMR